MRLILRLATLLMGVAMTVATTAAPSFAQERWPAEDAGAWGLAVVDIETTGLDPVDHEMIDLGAIYTDVDGEEFGRFFVRIRPDHPERADAGAMAVNGYSPERWSELETSSPAEAVQAFLAFHDAMTKAHPADDGEPRTWLFTAYNAWFDRAFLDALLLQHGSSMRALYNYFQLDVPSVAWGAGVRDLRNPLVAQKLGIEDETRDPLEHTGITGAQWTLNVYRAIREQEADSG